MEQFDITFRLALVVGVILYLVVIFFLLKKRKLSVQYSIIWLFSGFALLVFALVPYVVLVLGDILHIVNPVNFVFLVAIGFMLLILLSLSAAVSQLTEKNKTLTQNAALLERRIRELEQQMQAHKP
ncbi:MAG: DUF2304 domain-containing protein [Pygmaiobacter massiliensis]|nr:DUF2304 domain-containing protein [Pygmaiobacter massiliensis]